MMHVLNNTTYNTYKMLQRYYRNCHTISCRCILYDSPLPRPLRRQGAGPQIIILMVGLNMSTAYL